MVYLAPDMKGGDQDMGSLPNHCLRWNKWEKFQPVPLGSGGRKHPVCWEGPCYQWGQEPSSGWWKLQGQRAACCHRPFPRQRIPPRNVLPRKSSFRKDHPVPGWYLICRLCSVFASLSFFYHMGPFPKLILYLCISMEEDQLFIWFLWRGAAFWKSYVFE